MAIQSPVTPVRADHRFIQKVISTTLGGKVEQIPSEISRLSEVFEKIGGSWQGVFDGSVEDVVRLKKLIKFAFDRGYLTKKEEWI